MRPAGALTFPAAEVVATGQDHTGTAAAARLSADRGFIATGPQPAGGRDLPAVHVSQLRP